MCGICGYMHLDGSSRPSEDILKGMTERFLQNKDDLRKEIWGLFLFEMWYDRWMK